MSKPKITLENYQAIYDHYETYEPSMLLARVGHAAMNAAFRPKVGYALDAPDRIANLLDSGTRLVIAVNHLTDRDQYVVAAMANSQKSMRKLRGRTIIPSKKTLFENPLLRFGVDQMGAIPAFRNKDVRGDGERLPEDVIMLQKAASARLVDTCITKLDTGYHMAIFPEGERNEDGDPLIVQPCKRGIGDIILGCGPMTSVAIVPVGMHYGSHEYTPNLYVENPITEFPDDPVEIAQFVQEELQFSVRAAYRASQRR